MRDCNISSIKTSYACYSFEVFCWNMLFICVHKWLVFVCLLQAHYVIQHIIYQVIDDIYVSGTYIKWWQNILHIYNIFGRYLLTKHLSFCSKKFSIWCRNDVIGLRLDEIWWWCPETTIMYAGYEAYKFCCSDRNYYF